MIHHVHKLVYSVLVTKIINADTRVHYIIQNMTIYTLKPVRVSKTAQEQLVHESNLPGLISK